MGKKKPKCETCEFRGYSSDFCKLHKRKVSDEDCNSCGSHSSLKCVGKTAVLGAGVGAMAAILGVGAAPVVGLKAAIGHAMAAKMAAGGSAAGAGINMARKATKSLSRAKQRKKKRLLLPLYLKGS